MIHRLLDIIVPGKLYLGQKDFQQCMVLKRLTSLLKSHTQIIICPTRREPDGLAMSSRNLRLDEIARKKAPYIYEALLSIKKDIPQNDPATLTERATHLLTKNGFSVDYVEIANAATLETAKHSDGTQPLVALAAAFLGDVRLIDNLLL